MRRFRARRAAGAVLVPFELSAAGIGHLVDLGWLPPAQTSDPAAVRLAFADFVNGAATAGVRR
jgi:hypothetical protein